MLCETLVDRSMDERKIFADVDLPFHVWVREGRRWVLRDAADRLQGQSSARGRRDRDADGNDLGCAAGA